MWGMFFYFPQEIAYLICSHDLGAKKTAIFLEKIWDEENEHLFLEYQENKKRFLLDVYRAMDYYLDKDTMNTEFPKVEKDLNVQQESSLKELYDSEYQDLDLFFKCMRLKILYLNTQKYSKVKLKTLLTAYGYKRRTKELVHHIYEAMADYKLCVSLSQGKSCDLAKVPLDSMLIFRIDNGYMIESYF